MPIRCIKCDGELKSLSEDVWFCRNEVCQLHGIVVAVAKDENGQEIEIRTGDPC